jgi:hypothetical protein
MRAKTCLYRLGLNGKASQYMRLVERGRRPKAPKESEEQKKGEAQTILETFQEEPEELDISIAGKDVIKQLDSDFDDMGLVPYYFSKAARTAGDAISVGSYVRVPGLNRRFRVLEIMRHFGAIRLRDPDGIQYVFPWDIKVRPWEKD